MTTFDRIKKLSHERGLSLKDLAINLDFGESTLYKWKNQTPKTEYLEIVADYFGVTVDYLLGRENAPKWATQDDLFELDKMLESNVTMAYGGEELTDEEIQRVKDILTGIFWEKLEKKKKDK